ncbi:hypothetical protein ACERII_17975 [Evansella sp. AB-rgal1]|uniref:hypothetical protein n=1 Tax=Evansella sp. AB-rgal1 TaxID=3242696 RepID=UPI00359CDF9A
MKMSEVMEARTALLEKEKKVYLTTVNQINSQMGGLLQKDLGSQFVSNCGRDLAGELVRTFFDTTDYHITADQLMRRMLEFSYQNEYDPLGNNEEIHKLIYNYNDGPTSSTLNNIMTDLEQSKTKLFEKEKVVLDNGKTKSSYKDRGIIQKGKKAYRDQKTADQSGVEDEFTGKAESKSQNSLGFDVSNLDVDHTQALSTAYVYNRYLKEGGEERIREFYNSSENFTMMNKTANQSKGDVKVFDKTGNDITHRATPDQLADAVVQRWENIKGEEARGKLVEGGYLNEDGKVPKSVKAKLTSELKKSQNGESRTILKETDYKAVSKDAGKHAAKSLGKIVGGQVIYYTMPPLLYEMKGIMKDKHITLDNALTKLEQAGKRICKYVVSKLKNIFQGIAQNGLKTFIKSFFDILINMVKATVKKMIRLAKNLVLAVVDAVKIIGDKSASAAQKADSVFTLFSVTLTTFTVEILFEYIEKQFAIPEPLLLPLQIISTIICTNFSLLILQKADLFNVKHGLLIANIEEVFAKENQRYMDEVRSLSDSYSHDVERKLLEIQEETTEIARNLMDINLYQDSVQSDLESISEIFSMGIDFEKEWLDFLEVAN